LYQANQKTGTTLCGRSLSFEEHIDSFSEDDGYYTGYKLSSLPYRSYVPCKNCMLGLSNPAIEAKIIEEYGGGTIY
jgi:hypothetical protein